MAVPILAGLEAVMMAPTSITLAECSRTWDVVVVGAGVAGSVAARTMALRGLQVLLVEHCDLFLVDEPQRQLRRTGHAFVP